MNTERRESGARGRKAEICLGLLKREKEKEKELEEKERKHTDGASLQILGPLRGEIGAER